MIAGDFNAEANRLKHFTAVNHFRGIKTSVRIYQEYLKMSF
jgi:hypothetical protein